MIWNWASKEMPPKDLPVLLAWWNRDNKYNAEAVAIVKSNYDGTEWIEQTITDGSRMFNVDVGDMWAYIELPE